MSDASRRVIELTGADLLLVTSALDWLTSSTDDESVRLATGWPAVGVSWLSSALRGSPDAGEPGPAAREVADLVRRGLAEQGFAASPEPVAGRTVRLRFRRPDDDGGPEPRLAVDVVGAERPGDPEVHAHVRAGVHDPAIERVLAELTDAPAGRTQPVTAEAFLRDLVPGDRPEWGRIEPGERRAGVRALLRDVAGPAADWWRARGSRTALVAGLAAERHPTPAAARRLATGRALTDDPAGAAAALGRQIRALPSLPWPADRYTSAFLARFAARFGLDLGIAPAGPAPPAGARTPVVLRAGGRELALDAARVTVIVAALGAALDEDDLEFELMVGPSKAQAREVRARLLPAISRNGS